MRSHYCADLSKNEVGKVATVRGWIKRGWINSTAIMAFVSLWTLEPVTRSCG